MYIFIDGKIRNYIFITVLSVIIISLIAEFSVASNQDKNSRDNYAKYQQAGQLIEQKKFVQAEEFLSKLDKSDRESYQVFYARSICAANTGNFSTAADFMYKVGQIRPAFLMDQTYLMQYGAILCQLGKYDMAKLYLLESEKYNKDPQITKEAEKYLKQIKEKSGR